MYKLKIFGDKPPKTWFKFDLFWKYFFHAKNPNNTYFIVIEQIFHFVETCDRWNSVLFDFFFFWFLQKRNISMVFECTRKKIAFDSSAEMTVIAWEKYNFEWDNAYFMRNYIGQTWRRETKAAGGGNVLGSTVSASSGRSGLIYRGKNRWPG